MFGTIVPKRGRRRSQRPEPVSRDGVPRFSHDLSVAPGWPQTRAPGLVGFGVSNWIGEGWKYFAGASPRVLDPAFRDGVAERGRGRKEHLPGVIAAINGLE